MSIISSTTWRSQQGFTLIESLVGLLIITTVLVPALAIAFQSTRVATSIQNTLVASNLAQEGIEVIRTIRDDNWFANPIRPFDTGLTTCTAGCGVIWSSRALLPLGANPVLRFDSATGVYSYAGASVPTPFSRMITITSVSAEQLRIVVDVTWTEQGKAKVVSIESHLYDWK